MLSRTIIATIFWFAFSRLKVLVEVEEFQNDSLGFRHFVFRLQQFLLYWVEFIRSLQTNLLLKINALTIIFANLFIRWRFTVVLCDSIFLYFHFNLCLYSDLLISFNSAVNSNSMVYMVSSLLLNLQPCFNDMYSLICLFFANLNYAILC